jgi:hypothetical protein
VIYVTEDAEEKSIAIDGDEERNARTFATCPLNWLDKNSQLPVNVSLPVSLVDYPAWVRSCGLAFRLLSS